MLMHVNLSSTPKGIRCHGQGNLACSLWTDNRAYRIRLIDVRPTSDFAACATCGQHSNSIHSRYPRLLSDLPSEGRLVRIKSVARRFRCLLADCRQRIFVERLEGALARPFARRTSRLEGWFIISASHWPASQDRASRGVCSRQ